MDGYFQYLVDKYAVAESGQNCDAGAHQGTYTIGDQHGRQDPVCSGSARRHALLLDV